VCGRFTYAKEFRDIAIRFDLDHDIPLFRPRYNIAPGQQVAVIFNREGARTLAMIQWGLVPSWAKDPAIGNRMINARAETLAEKPSFKRLIGKRRCVVPADGFYEWRKERKRKVPMRIRLKSEEPFGFAGLWDSWRKPDGKELQSFTIITTEANDLLGPIHDRMPVILAPDGEKLWLESSLQDFSKVSSLLKPYPSDQMEVYEVSTLVNSPRNDLRACIEEDA
jgi:putative SOS response-associated peptidase YedK